MSAFPPHRLPLGLEGPAALGRELAAARPDAALMLVALEGLDAVQLRDGFTAGDALLARTVAALEAAVRAAPGNGAPGNVGTGAADPAVFRLAGDELAVVLPGAGDGGGGGRAGREGIVEVGTALVRAAMDASALGACGGVVPVVLDAAGLADVRRSVHDAGLALRAARHVGSGCARGPSGGGAALTAAEEEDLEVRTLLRSGAFELHFQPLVDPTSGRPSGVEALIRSRTSSGTLAGPGGFLPQVRRSGLSVELGTAILADALARWSGRLRGALGAASTDAGAPGRVLTVNVDVDQVEQDGFDGLVLHLLERSDVPPEELVLEVTEAVLAGAAARTRLQRLRDAGVRVAIDDFGSGPVVLSEIRALPVDILKVDQVLVGRLDRERPDVGLIEDLLRLAGLLGLQLAVEAVETPALATRIAELGVPIAQGYHYARPMPPGELAAWLDGRR